MGELILLLARGAIELLTRAGAHDAQGAQVGEFEFFGFLLFGDLGSFLFGAGGFGAAVGFFGGGLHGVVEAVRGGRGLGLGSASAMMRAVKAKRARKRVRRCFMVVVVGLVLRECVVYSVSDRRAAYRTRLRLGETLDAIP